MSHVALTFRQSSPESLSPANLCLNVRLAQSLPARLAELSEFSEWQAPKLSGQVTCACSCDPPDMPTLWAWTAPQVASPEDCDAGKHPMPRACQGNNHQGNLSFSFRPTLCFTNRQLFLLGAKAAVKGLDGLRSIKQHLSCGHKKNLAKDSQQPMSPEGLWAVHAIHTALRTAGRRPVGLKMVAFLSTSL